METQRAGEGCKTFTAHLDKSKNIDTLTLIDMSVVKVLKRLNRTKFAVEFCDRCAKLCDASCRGAEIRERALSLRLEVRF